MNLPAVGSYAGDPFVADEKYAGSRKGGKASYTVIEEGHSIAPRYVENCIRNGVENFRKSDKRYEFQDGNVIVITDISKKIVISVGYRS